MANKQAASSPSKPSESLYTQYNKTKDEFGVAAHAYRLAANDQQALEARYKFFENTGLFFIWFAAVGAIGAADLIKTKPVIGIPLGVGCVSYFAFVLSILGKANEHRGRKERFIDRSKQYDRAFNKMTTSLAINEHSEQTMRHALKKYSEFEEKFHGFDPYHDMPLDKKYFTEAKDLFNKRVNPW